MILPFASRALVSACVVLAVAGCGQAATGQTATGQSESRTESLTEVAVPKASDDSNTAGPEQHIEALYANLDTHNPSAPALPLTAELDRLFAAERAEQDRNGGAPNVIDFDWAVGGQDFDISDVDVILRTGDPGETIVNASFRNFGEPQIVRYLWKQENGEWRLDDIFVEGDDQSIAQMLRAAYPDSGSRANTTPSNYTGWTNEEAALIAHFEALSSQCRGGRGDDPQTVAACEERDSPAFRSALDRANICFGQEGQAGFERQFHRCGPGSRRMTQN